MNNGYFWDGVDSRGQAGGLFLAWSPNVVFVVRKTFNFIFCRVSPTRDAPYYVVFVYGAPCFEDRAEIWNQIQSLFEQYLGNHLILEDFNQVEKSAQKLGGNRYIRGAVDFCLWRITCNLMELPY